MKSFHTSKSIHFFAGIGVVLLLTAGCVVSAASPAHAATVKAPSTVGLIGYWPFDDNGGTKANDLSGSRNTGTLVNSPVWVTSGRSGKGIFFNGSTTSGSYVTIPTVGASASAGSISFWAYATTSQVTGGYLVNTTGTGERIYFNYAVGNSISLVLGSTAIGIGSAAAPLGRRHHVVGEWSGTTGTLYVDGAFVASTTFAGLASVLNPMYVGSFGGTQGFNGIIDEVRFYNRAISASEVKSLYQYGVAKTQVVQTAGTLLGYWPMNDGSGTKANDMSGNRNTATLFGSPTWVTGKLGKGINFNAATNYIKMSSFPLGGTQKVSVSYWYKVPPPSGSTYQMMELSADANANNDGSFWQFAYSDSSVYQAAKFTTSLYGVGPVYNTVTYTAPSPGWHFFTFIYDRSKASQQVDSVYIDGVPQALTYITSTLGAGTTFKTYDLYMGARGGISYFSSGIMDDVHLYTRILSSAEIVSAYRQGASTANASTNTFMANGLIGLWSFDGKDINWNTNQALNRGSSANNAILNNFSTTTSPSIGKIGQALSFNGVSNYVDTSSNMANNDMTISMWIKPRVAAGYLATEGVINSGIRFYLKFTTGKIDWSCYDGAYETATTDNTITTNQWTHIVGTIKSGQSGGVKIYVNGAVQSVTGTAANCPSYGILYLGSYIWPISGYYDGYMDDVRIYNRALSAGEVKQLYSSAR